MISSLGKTCIALHGIKVPFAFPISVIVSRTFLLFCFTTGGGVTTVPIGRYPLSRCAEGFGVVEGILAVDAAMILLDTTNY